MMVMEMATGSPFSREVRPEQVHLKKEAGGIIVDELVQQLFTKGFMNADPHQGNFLIDYDTKTISPIDFGQAEQLKLAKSATEDERSLLGSFLIALNKKNVPEILRLGTQFCSPVPSREVQSAIDARLKLLKAEGRIDFTQFINAFNELGAHFSKRFFGILKGLAVLQKEEYVSEPEFISILTQALVKRKTVDSLDSLPAVFWKVTDGIKKLQGTKRVCPPATSTSSPASSARSTSSSPTSSSSSSHSH
jgi:hypothetical protein